MIKMTKNPETTDLKLGELLNALSRRLGDTENVESDSLAQRPALADHNLVTLFHTEARRNVSSEVLVPLFVSVILGNVVEVLAADNESAVHLGGHNSASENAAADRDETSKWTLLVNVFSVDSSLGGLETQTDILIPSSAVLARPSATGLDLMVEKDVRLLLESLFALDGKFGSHGCGLADSSRKRKSIGSGVVVMSGLRGSV